MATQIWVNIDSGNDLMPDGTKPLHEPVLTYWQFDRNTKLFIHENAFENFIWEIVTILSRGDELMIML